MPGVNRLIAVVLDSVTLRLVDSSLIHTAPWVIGPAHWFPGCQPSQEELGSRERLLLLIGPGSTFAPENNAAVHADRTVILRRAASPYYQTRLLFLDFYATLTFLLFIQLLFLLSAIGWTGVMSWPHPSQAALFFFWARGFSGRSFSEGVYQHSVCTYTACALGCRCIDTLLYTQKMTTRFSWESYVWCVLNLFLCLYF